MSTNKKTLLILLSIVLILVLALGVMFIRRCESGTDVSSEDSNLELERVNNLTRYRSMLVHDDESTSLFVAELMNEKYGEIFHVKEFAQGDDGIDEDGNYYGSSFANGDKLEIGVEFNTRTGAFSTDASEVYHREQSEKFIMNMYNKAGLNKYDMKPLLDVHAYSEYFEPNFNKFITSDECRVSLSICPHKNIRNEKFAKSLQKFMSYMKEEGIKGDIRYDITDDEHAFVSISFDYAKSYTNSELLNSEEK